MDPTTYQNAAETLLAKLNELAAEAAPHESIQHDMEAAFQLRNKLQDEIRDTRDWDQVKPLHAKLRDADEKFQHLDLHKFFREEAIKKAWCLACDEFGDRAPALREELAEAAGLPVKFGAAELLPPTFTEVSEALIQRQCACAVASPHHAANISNEGRAVIAMVKQITKALPVIRAERAALEAAAATYQKTISTKAA